MTGQCTQLVTYICNTSIFSNCNDTKIVHKIYIVGVLLGVILPGDVNEHGLEIDLSLFSIFKVHSYLLTLPEFEPK